MKTIGKIRSWIRDKVNWKTKILLSILGAIIFVEIALYGVTYGFFVKKLQQSDAQMTQMTFSQAEANLEQIIKSGMRDENQYDLGGLAWDFSSMTYGANGSKPLLTWQIAGFFDQLLRGNPYLYAIAQINGNGDTIFSTRQRSRTDRTKLSPSLKALMEKSKEHYPDFCWTSLKEEDWGEDSSLGLALGQPAIIGIRCLDRGRQISDDSFILIAITEKAIRSCYEPVAYNGSRAVLVDQEGRVISATDDSLLYKTYIPDPGSVNISHPLSYNNWTLVDMMPKENYQERARSIRNFSLIILLFAGVLVFFIAMAWSRSYIRPIQNLIEMMDMAGREQLDMEKPKRSGYPELDQLNMEFYQTVQKLKQHMARLSQTEQEKAREELRALQYQINPHFLYNSLNSIRWMAMMTNNKKVADSLVMLNKIIAPVFRNPSFTWKVSDELEFLNNYIGMMLLRYGGSLDYQMDCPGELEDCQFPRFILQPVMENCFVHGKSDSGAITIQASIRKTRGRFSVAVCNLAGHVDQKRLEEVNQGLGQEGLEGNGPGRNEPGRNRQDGNWESVGLYNVARRLRFLYGEGSTIQLAASQGVMVLIEFGEGE